MEDKVDEQIHYYVWEPGATWIPTPFKKHGFKQVELLKFVVILITAFVSWVIEVDLWLTKTYQVPIALMLISKFVVIASSVWCNPNEGVYTLNSGTIFAYQSKVNLQRFVT